MVALNIPKLSICIATFRRADFIVDTLDSIMPHISSNVEVLVVDGASPDDTYRVMTQYSQHYPQIRYIREAVNSGVDADFDKAVEYAKGDYCWLMTDDDRVLPGAIRVILEKLKGEPDLLVVNAKVSTRDFSKVLRSQILVSNQDRHYDETSYEEFFSQTGDYLSFIGAVIIKRRLWLSRKRQPYYGTLFIHVGVIFQSPIRNIQVIAEPQINIRYGNAMWGPRSFEIWMYKWPNLIWSFSHISDQARKTVCAQKPYKNLKKLVWFRAIGAYSLSEYRRFFSGQFNLLPLLVVFVPGRLLNALSAVRCAFAKNPDLASIYDLSTSRHTTWATRRIAQKAGL